MIDTPTLTAEAEVLKCRMAVQVDCTQPDPLFKYICLVNVNGQHFYIQINEHHKRGAVVEIELGQFEDIYKEYSGRNYHVVTRFNGVFGGQRMCIEMQGNTGQEFIKLLESETD